MTRTTISIRVHGSDTVPMTVAGGDAQAFTTLRAYGVPAIEARALIAGELTAYITTHPNSGIRFAVWCRKAEQEGKAS